MLGGVLTLLAAGVALFHSARVGAWICGRSRSAPAAQFVGRASCVGCHAREDSLWRGSRPEQAMQPATHATVLGNFNGAAFTHFGVTSTFTARDG